MHSGGRNAPALPIWLWLATQNTLPVVVVGEAFPFERNPDQPCQGSFPRLRMRDGAHEPISIGRGATLTETRFTVECWADGSADAEGAIPTACVGLYARVCAALAADPYLGGLAECVREVGFTLQSGDAEWTKPTRMLAATFAIEHEVRPGSVARAREDVLAAVEAILRDELPPASGTTRYELVVQAFLARLASELPGVTIRRHPVGQALFGEVHVFDDGADVGRPESYTQLYTATIRVALPATAATDDDTGDAANALADAVHAALDSDRTLGGACDRLEQIESDEPAVDDGGFTGPGLGLGLTYQAAFLTDEVNPAALPAWAA